MIKDTDERADGRNSWGGLCGKGNRASVAPVLAATSQCLTCSPCQKFPRCVPWEFLCGHDWSLSPPSALLPYQDNRGRGELQCWELQASDHGLVFLVTGLIQEPSQNHLIRIKDTPLTQEISVVSGALRQEQRVETKIYFILSHSQHNLFSNFWLTLLG